jgi:hypothetical protein
MDALDRFVVGERREEVVVIKPEHIVQVVLVVEVVLPNLRTLGWQRSSRRDTANGAQRAFSDAAAEVEAEERTR